MLRLLPDFMDKVRRGAVKCAVLNRVLWWTVRVTATLTLPDFMDKVVGGTAGCAVLCAVMM
jgi:hypothetical protein